MSRKGKKPVKISDKIEVKVEPAIVTVKGPKGELSMSHDGSIGIDVQDGQIVFTNESPKKEAKAKHGLYRSLIANMVEGVSEGYKKDLELVGIGYRVQKQGSKLVISLGFSHPVEIEPPEGIALDVEGQNKISVSGIDKQKVGQVASNIRRIRKTDPYKGKGIRYAGEVIRRKQGKSVKK